MKGWERTPRQVVCGKCCAVIAIGDPVFVYANAEFKWRKFRCVTCAGPAPADLPELEVRSVSIHPTPITPKPPRPYATRIGTIAEDFKIKQSGDRE